jgi:LmbE family N-acetylglucosaminyl deacetylase
VIENLEESAIVVAHPDDENLWFSSILSRVGQILVCYLDVATDPALTSGRRESLAAYPLSGITCLGLDESDIFWGVDWSRAEETDYGLRINDRRLSDRDYIANFPRLKVQLQEHLQGRRRVFTHSPWGEYGHPEHVQVYRAVRAVQSELGFTLWYPSYASNKSAGLMARVLASGGHESFTLPTDRALAERIADLYKQHRCWTWYPDYAWPETESFIRDPVPPASPQRFGTTFPINFIRTKPPPAIRTPWERRIRRWKRPLRRLRERLGL